MSFRFAAAVRLSAVAAAVVAAAMSGVVAQVGDRSAIDTAPPPAHWEIPRAPVRTPEQSLRVMDVQAGFRVEVVAAEPLVQDPVSFAFDARGRLWVLEWPTYNWDLHGVLPGLDPQPRPSSRIVLLEDTNADGRMDTRTVFAELDWPRGIQLLDDGVLVFALPDVMWLRDTTGDGRADRREVVIGGLPIPVNPHSAPSSPLLAMDNWIYALQVGERLRLRDGRREALPTGRLAGQWGLSQDDYGRLRFSYNQDHLRGSQVPAHYAARNPNYDATAGIDERIGLDNEVWPHAITPGVNRRAQLRDDGRLRVFTANAAPSVYRAAHFPPEYEGNVFVGESAGRLIRRVVLSERDGIVTGRNAYPEHEFLFSHDERFRPVFSATGPDGALYVADMYRGIIEGNIFLTTFLRNQILDRGLHRPFHGMGRIYRIVHEARPLDAPPDPLPHTTAEWVPHLAHRVGHWRDTAQRAIVASGDIRVVPQLRTMATSHADDRVRLHAMWTLEGLGATSGDSVRTWLADSSPYVRAAAIRMAERFLDETDVRRAVLARVADEAVMVQWQVLFSMSVLRTPEVESAVLALLDRLGDDPIARDAAMSGLEGREWAVLQNVAASDVWATDTPGHRSLVTALATAVVNEGHAERVEALFTLVGDAAQQPAWRRVAIIDGAQATRRPSLSPMPSALTALRASADRDVRERSEALVRKLATGPQQDRTVNAATAAQIEVGRQAYAMCGACHQPDGRGLPSLAPPLAGAESVMGPPDALIDIVLQGRDVNPAYPMMPPLAGLDDDQLAAILTYIRQAWGNDAPAVAPNAVQSRR